MKCNIKRTLKITGIIIGSFSALILLYLGSAHCLSRIAMNITPKSGEYATIYILTNGVHTDIVVPIKSDVINWSNILKYEHTVGKDSVVDYVAFGWGRQGFLFRYTDLGRSKVFRCIQSHLCPEHIGNARYILQVPERK